MTDQANTPYICGDTLECEVSRQARKEGRPLQSKADRGDAGWYEVCLTRTRPLRYQAGAKKVIGTENSAQKYKRLTKG